LALQAFDRGKLCAICDDVVGGINPVLQGKWLHWRALPGASALRRLDNNEPDDVSLGVHGHYEFFAERHSLWKVPKFALLVLGAATQTDTAASSASGAGGSSSGGGSTTPKPNPSFLDTQTGGVGIFVQ
jgi:hypothetical protein